MLPPANKGEIAIIETGYSTITKYPSGGTLENFRDGYGVYQTNQNPFSKDHVRCAGKFIGLKPSGMMKIHRWDGYELTRYRKGYKHGSSISVDRIGEDRYLRLNYWKNGKRISSKTFNMDANNYRGVTNAEFHEYRHWRGFEIVWIPLHRRFRLRAKKLHQQLRATGIEKASSPIAHEALMKPTNLLPV